MANKKITDLPDIGTPASGDLLEIVDISEGVSKRVAVSNLGSSLQVYESGETPIENVDEIEFDGATVTDDGGGKVTVTVTGGVGIPDAPNDTFGYIRKALGWTKSTLSEALNGGKTATFDDGTYTTNINIGDGGIVEFTVFKNDSTEIQTFYLSNVNSRLYSVKWVDETLEQGQTAVVDSNQGRVILEEQDNFLGSSATKSLKFEDFTEAETVGDPVIDYRIKKKLVTGTYYLVDEEYVNNGFIPLSGTTVGNPVTGDVEVLGAGLITGSTSGAVSKFYEEDGSFFWEYSDGINPTVTIGISVAGLYTNIDLSSIDPSNLNIYAQRQYVQNQIQNTTITIELFDALEVDFYAPDDLKINSTAVIVGSGTITLKVNNVAYTLGALINQGDKITVTTTALSTVVNLVGKYE